jgi:hypothetical protein
VKTVLEEKIKMHKIQKQLKKMINFGPKSTIPQNMNIIGGTDLAKS